MGKRKPVDVIAIESIQSICDKASSELEEVFTLLESNYKLNEREIPDDFHTYKRLMLDHLTILSISSESLAKSISDDGDNLKHEYAAAVKELREMKG